MSQSCADACELTEGLSADLLNTRAAGELMSLTLLQYQGRDWHGHLRLHGDAPEFFSFCLTCDADAAVTVDLSVHVTCTASRLLLSLFSPCWIVNRTSRVLRYRADDVTVKHPANNRDVILFSFRKKNLLSKNKVRTN